MRDTIKNYGALVVPLAYVVILLGVLTWFQPHRDCTNVARWPSKAIWLSSAGFPCTP